MQTTFLDDSSIEVVNSEGAKAAKLSTFKNFYPNTLKIMNGVRAPKEEVAPAVESPAQETSAPTPETPAVDTSNYDLLKAKADKFNVNVFLSLASENNKEEAHRRLRVNALVVDILRNTENVLGVERTPEVSPVENEMPTEDFAFDEPSEKKETFDFSSLPNVGVQETNTGAEIDQWLNRESVSSKDLNDPILQEVNELQAERDNNKMSLETQKRILEELRGRIEQNKALCEVKKEELKQENMALTQELNDVLAQINQLTEVAKNQEAFLGNKEYTDTYSEYDGMSKNV